MPLLNYTTTVRVNRTIGQVQGLLVEGGARLIVTDYDAVGHPTGIAFTAETVLGPRHFVLPSTPGGSWPCYSGNGCHLAMASPTRPSGWRGAS